MATTANAPLHNRTEDALTDEMGHPPSARYFLRADQMNDGSYRYALEERDTGRVLAEAMHADEHQALAEFEKSLASSGLSQDEIETLRHAADRYDGRDE